MNLNRPGIYQIINKVNGKVYIGQSINIRRRWSEHRKSARSGETYPIYNAIRKYGLDNFHFGVLEFCSIDVLDDREQEWLDATLAYTDSGYNVSPSASSTKGLVRLESRKPVYKVDRQTGQILKRYDSRKAAAEDVGVDSSCITDAVLGKCKFIKNYFWTEEPLNFVLPASLGTGKERRKSVIQLDSHGKQVNTFISQVHAGKHTGISTSSISQACRGTRKSAGGYYWKYSI